jgi:hypothetical protein
MRSRLPWFWESCNKCPYGFFRLQQSLLMQFTYLQLSKAIID